MTVIVLFKPILCLLSEEKLYCVYVAIGQKRSTVAQIMKRLENAGNYVIMEDNCAAQVDLTLNIVDSSSILNNVYASHFLQWITL